MRPRSAPFLLATLLAVLPLGAQATVKAQVIPVGPLIAEDPSIQKVIAPLA